MSNYVGIPFVDKGREASGLDCWGLVRLWYRQERCIDLPCYADIYTDTQDERPISDEIKRAIDAEWIKIESKHAREGDVIILRMRGVPMHVGIVTKRGYMLHCEEGVGVALERYDSARWASRVVGFVRYAG